ncbi:hypothetical protein WJX74_003643 [Apatococcus lobatus]|uniref:TsaA-like domain-containing protein n=1 Tax=Apatococcus lobatus TaxID=904363 RepID=A0AAW1SB59_9CHLO
MLLEKKWHSPPTSACTQRSSCAASAVRPGMPTACLDGLEAFSHCWLIYIFHANTDLDTLLTSQAARQPHPSAAGDSREGIKGKVRVPRLNGGRVGVLSTRTPHRPCPIGLSVARIERVNGNQLEFSGADVVDGSPILDVKPYLPFCDSWPAAACPAWVEAQEQEEPLRISSVQLSSIEAGAQLHTAWAASNHRLQQLKQPVLYPAYDSFLTLVREVLSLDIRSAHQRLHEASTTSAAVNSIPLEHQQPSQPVLKASTGGLQSAAGSALSERASEISAPGIAATPALAGQEALEAGEACWQHLAAEASLATALQSTALATTPAPAASSDSCVGGQSPQQQYLPEGITLPASVQAHAPPAEALKPQHARQVPDDANTNPASLLTPVAPAASGSSVAAADIAEQEAMGVQVWYDIVGDKRVVIQGADPWQA